jgi:sorbitol-specific phosphotransferase system component IIBC
MSQVIEIGEQITVGALAEKLSLPATKAYNRTIQKRHYGYY